MGSRIDVDAVRPLRIPVVGSRSWTYGVSADGQRFLVALPPEQNVLPAPLTLVYNWPLC